MEHKATDIVLLGMRDEVLPIDLSYTDEEEIAMIMDFVHELAYTELLSREIMSMWEWSVRTQGVLAQNNLIQVGHIVGLSKIEVNRMAGCGYKTRKEIYDVYKSYGLIMPNWSPGMYYEKANYQFNDEEEIER